jgi:PKD repeat protein
MVLSTMMISAGVIEEQILEAGESTDSSPDHMTDDQRPNNGIAVVGSESVISEPYEPILSSAANEKPVAIAGADRTVDTNELVVFDGSKSYDPDGSIVSYTWYFQDIFGLGSGKNPTHSYSMEGFYFVILVVEDDAGATDQDTVVITVHNEYPDAQAQMAMNIAEGQSVTLDAGGTRDTKPDETFLVYSWDFGDGSTGSGSRPTHTYSAPGFYNVILTVTDNDGIVDRDEVAVNVMNLPPHASAGADQIVNEDGPVTFDASGTTDSPSDQLTLTYSWDFVDGATGSGISPVHVYSNPGTYTVELTVMDDNGASDSDTMKVTVNNAPPVADAGSDQTASEDQPVFFSGQGYDTPSDEPTLTYQWDFGDGTEGFGKNPVHRYTEYGTYTVILNVVDDDGGSGQDIMTVTVANIGPVVDAGPDLEVNEDVPVQFTGHAYDTPSDEQSLSYSWDFGDGNPGTGQNPVHSYTGAGTYTVTLTASDHNGFSASDSLQVTVKNIPPQVIVTCESPHSIVLAGDVLTFNANAHDSPSDMSTLTYSWDFGDGTTAFGTPATHSYFMDGIYEVVLTVSDDDGATGSDKLIIIVDRHSMEIEITPIVDEVMPGETAEYVINLHNTGTIDDAYDITLTTTIDPLWVELHRMHVTAPPGDEVQIPLLITPPETLSLDADVILHFDVLGVCTHTAAEVSNAPQWDSPGDDTIVTATYESRLRWVQKEIESAITDFSGGNPTDATLLKALEEVSEALFFAPTIESPEFDYVKSFEHVKNAIHNLEMLDESLAADRYWEVLLTGVDSKGNEIITTAAIQAGNDSIHVIDAWALFSNAQERILAGDFENGMEQYKNAYMEAARAKGEWVPEDYTNALLQAIDDIDLLLTGPYSASALNKLQLARDELILALDNTDYGLMQDSFVNVKSAVTHLQVAESMGVPTNDIMSDLTNAIGDATEMLISETETHVGMEVNDIKQAWSKFYLGKSFSVMGQYIQAIDKFDGAYKHALLAEDWIPIADAGYDQTTTEDEVVFFDASNSRDRDGIVLFYEWDFGDGHVDYGVFTDHAYKNAGTYIVTLLVTDNEGLMDTDTIVITVNNIIPTAELVLDYIMTSPTEPDSVYMDDIVLFDAISTDTFSDMPGLVVKWDFGDDTIEYGAHVKHIYTFPGTYTVTLCITDDNGDFDTDSAVITVRNVIPEARVVYSQIAYEDEVVYLSGMGLDSPSHRDSLSYSWDFGDGSFGSGREVTHVYTNEGIYTVTLMVTDPLGDFSSDSITVSVVNPVPSADAGWAQYSEEDGVVNFIGTGLDNPSDQSSLTYLWDFGDGSFGSGASQSHMYSISGTYIVTLTVTDDNGDLGVNRIPVFVENVLPEAYAGGDQTVNEDEMVLFSGSGSDTPSDLPFLTYSWDFGDGSSGSGMAPVHVYTRQGSYIVILTVMDDDGAMGHDISIVTVENLIPMPDAGPDMTADEDELIFFSASATDTPSDHSKLKYEWDFGDGSSPASGSTCTHTYHEVGLYTVTLTVMDDDRTFATDTMDVVVNNVAPYADAGPDLMVSGRPRYLDFQGVGLDTPSDRPSLTYLWDFGDGNSANGVFAQHLYTDAGFYTVILTVTDDDGGSATDSLTVLYYLDSDEDGLPDHWEIAFGLDPNDARGDNGGQGDPDSDGLINLEEYGYKTHPRNRDTDGDSWNDNLWDKEEIEYWLSQGYTPEQAGLNANTWDVDSDKIPDGWEVWYAMNPGPGTAYKLHHPDNRSDSWRDWDDDGFTNYWEYKLRNRNAHPHIQDVFVEVDWMAGYYPDTTMFDYIEDYYAARNNIHLVFEMSEEIPYDPEVNITEWNDLHDRKASGGYFDNVGTHKHMIYGSVYFKPPNIYPFGINYEEEDDQLFIAHETCADTAVLYNLAVVAFATTSAIAAATAAGIAAAIIALPLGAIAAAAAYAIAYAAVFAATFATIVALMSITLWQAVTATIMHEFGHSISIITYDTSVYPNTEVYCPNGTCVMAGADTIEKMIFLEMLKPDPEYCDYCWSLIDLSPIKQP